MTVRDIRLFGDPVLREVCRPVTDFGPGLSRLVTDLTGTFPRRLPPGDRRQALRALRERLGDPA